MPVLTRHPALSAALLLCVTLAACFLTRQETTPASISLPMTSPAAVSADPIEQYRTQRDQAALQDMAALQTLVDQPELDDQTRQDAALQLQALVDNRQMQQALEGALVESGLSPCVAVVCRGKVTIITRKEKLSDQETALLLTLARTHANAAPSQVHVILPP